ncbi:hypothetical protein RKE29_26290 [Streptomyces sp. B1866]|uniref:hypothetical protein n=1 Tax=Streptomyces sp. B1866 TaxID=3075431 RepID=UPI0028929442|nr:hypothetical protein [Streptomyces sp. B1866]MDT3400094.1 hypothetical protein [Streptomyces sp. B1866]
MASAVALAALGVREWRRRGAPANGSLTGSLCFYLHNEAVMDLYRMGRYTEALTQQVERKTSGSTEARVESAVAGARAGVGRQRGEEKVSKYVSESSPIDVIGILVSALEDEDAIVYVNLVTGTVRHNGALARTLTATGRSVSQARDLRLRDVEDYVLLRARFRLAAHDPHRGPDETVFHAPYGNPEDPEDGPRVRVTCATEGLRNADVRRGTFSARCLGKVEDWNAEEGVLEVRAIAIFV